MPDTDKKNIRAHPTRDVMWDFQDPVGSLRAVRKSVEEEGQKAIDWYWRSKRSKSDLSQVIQFSALSLTALAGIAPVVVQVAKNFTFVPANFDSGPIATLCVGLAASLLGLDKAFGFSSGWTRYVLAATNLTKLLHEFRLDWTATVAASADPPTLDQQAKLIQRARDFVSTVQGMVLQETKDWATEFQSNIAQMEKDLKTQLDELKAQVEKSAQDKGSIVATVTDADQTDGFHFDVTLEGSGGKTVESVSNSKVWAAIDLKPGQYKLTIDGKMKGNPISTSTVVEVKAGETENPTLAL